MILYKSFETAKMVVEEATKQFAPCWELSVDKLSACEQYCSVFDSFLKETDAKMFSVSVDEIQMTVALSSRFEKIEFESSKSFARLTECALKTTVEPSEDEWEVTFIFSSLWKKSVFSQGVN